MTEERLLRLVDDIYTAALEPATWPAVLERLADELGGSASGIHRLDHYNPGGSAAVVTRFNPEYVRLYEQHYAGINPRVIKGGHLLKQGKIVFSHQQCPDAGMDRTEFCCDWLEPQKIFHSLGLVILEEGHSTTNLTLFRSRGKGPFTTEQGRFLRELAPHFKRAAQVESHIGCLHAERQGLLDALDRMPVGIVLLDAKRQAVFVNGAASSILETCDGLEIERDELLAAGPTDSTRLRGLISSSIDCRVNGGTRPGGAMQLQRPSGRRPLSVLVAPLHRFAFGMSSRSPVAVLFVSDPEEKLESPESLLCRLYHLTHAEARVAARIIQGKDLREVADELGVSHNTVRSQAGAILAKTGASRQSDLVRLLLRGPAGLVGVQ